MVSMIPCKCPYCNAEIQVDKSKEFAFCSYCGTKLIIHDDTVTTHYEIHRTIDDAAIKRAESTDRLENRKLDQAEKKSKLKFKLVLAYILACVILCVLAYVLLRFAESYIGAFILLFAILLITLPIVLFLTHLIFKYGKTVVLNDSKSSWFGLKKESHDYVRSPAMSTLILWGFYILIVLTVFFFAYDSKKKYYPSGETTKSENSSFLPMTFLSSAFSSMAEADNKKEIGPSVMDNIYDNINGDFVINTEDIGSTYIYLKDGWDYYKATVLSEKTIKIENYSRFLKNDKEKFEFDHDIGIINNDDVKHCFSWFDDSHKAFIIKMNDTEDSSLNGKYIPFLRFDLTSNNSKKVDILENPSAYIYQYDKWYSYKAMIVSDDLIKIECWSRTLANDETPYEFDHDLAIIKTDDLNNDFEWMDENKTSFSVTLKDINDTSIWEEDMKVHFKINELDEQYNVLDFIEAQ